MDGRETLDIMNNEVLAAIRQNVAPWRKPVIEGQFNHRASNVYSNNDMLGLGGWHLEIAANKKGWHSPLWVTERDAKIDDREIYDGERPTAVIEIEFINNKLHTHTYAFYCANQIKDIDKGGRIHQVDADERIHAIFTAMGLVCERVTQNSIAKLCRKLEAGEMGQPEFKVMPAEALNLRNDMVLGIVGRSVGQGDIGEPQVGADAVSEALEQDPFWLARVAMEAEFAAGRLLAPLDHLRDYGREADRREKLEQYFDTLRTTEKRQYLAVPFEDNAEVKAKGGRFDQVTKAWYVPDGKDINDFAKWDRPTDISPEAEFADTMRHHGLLIEGDAIMDGQSHRVMLEGQRPGSSPAGSYKGYLDGRPAGHFINFRDGDGKAVKWVASGHRVDPELRSITAKEIEAKREARKLELVAKQDAAAKRAENIWKGFDIRHSGKLNPSDLLHLPRLYGLDKHHSGQPHPYLQAKGVEAWNVSISRDGKTLYIPVCDVDRKLQSLQIIFRDNEDSPFKKRFLKDSRKEGGFHLLDRDDVFGAEPTLIAEGYATAASVHEATGRPVVVAFDANNLKPVAEALYSRIVDYAFIFIADDDRKLNVNIGLEKAKEAAEAVGGAVVVPSFDEAGQAAGLTDFNDLHQHVGIEAVGRQLNHAMAQFFPDFRARKTSIGNAARVFQSDDMMPALSPKWEAVLCKQMGIKTDETSKGRRR